MRSVLRLLALTLGAVVLASCRMIGLGSSCHDPQPYQSAESVPPLKIPPGLEAPDTRNALRVPPLNEPEPPPRKEGDPCLDAPPKYATPQRPQA